MNMFPTLDEQEDTIPLVIANNSDSAELAVKNANPLENMRTFLSQYQNNAQSYKSKLPEKVDSKESASLATNIAGSAKSELKLIESHRKDVTAPMNDVVKKINGLCKEISDPLTEVETVAKRRIGIYLQEQEMERKKLEILEQERAAQEQERLNAKAKELGTVAPLVPEIVMAESNKSSCTRTENGSSFVKKTWTFILEDLNKVSKEYMVLDERKVREAIKNGVRSIDGIKIFEQSNVSIRN